MEFVNFWHIVWIFVFVPLLLGIYMKRRLKPSLRFSSLVLFGGIKDSLFQKSRHILLALRILAIILLVVALMRPQKGIEESKIETEGIDIILAVDVSGSMMAEDFVVDGKRQNRLEVVKTAVKDFIQKRHNDRIGLVVFAGAAYTQCPPTLDYGVLMDFLDRTEVGMLEDGTAVGDGLATALNRLRKLDSKSKVVILLTDGVSNTGRVDPKTATGLAEKLGIRVYTIGAGSKGRVPFPARDFFGNKVYQWAVIDLDERSLADIARRTGGRYFRATDTENLKKIYDEIDSLEKSKIDMNLYSDYQEHFGIFVLWALALLFFETLLKNTRFRSIP